MKAVAAFQEAQTKGKVKLFFHPPTHPPTHSPIQHTAELSFQPPTHPPTHLYLKAIVLICDEESAETTAELISRNKPPVIADVEPLTKGQ